MITQDVFQIRIQERDRLLFERLCQTGYLTLKQIAVEVLRTSPASACRRLSRLKRSNFITDARRFDRNGSKVYIPVLENLAGLVSYDSWIQGSEALGQKVVPWRRPNQEHDELVRTWGLKFLEEVPNLHLILEYSLSDSEWGYKADQKELKKVPDFVLVHENERKVGFEIELNPKSSKVYYPILNKALLRIERPIVYITGGPAIKAKISNILIEIESNFKTQSVFPKSKVFVFEMSELQSKSAIRELLMKVFGQQVVNSGVNGMSGVINRRQDPGEIENRRVPNDLGRPRS